jgi:integrase/recombinase XerC
MIDLGSTTVQAIADWLEERGSCAPDSPLFIALDSAHSGHRRKRRWYLQDGCPSQQKGWYQKTDVPSPYQALSYHGGTGRNRRGCRKVQKLSRHRNLNTLMVYDDNRGRDQQDVTQLLDGMF